MSTRRALRAVSQAVRTLHTSPTPKSGSTIPSRSGTNAALSFPCVDQHITRERLLKERSSSSNFPIASTSQPNSSAEDQNGPEPAYSAVVSGYEVFHYPEAFQLDYGGVLPNLDIAYETWGSLNEGKSNAILLHTGLSASSHAHSTPKNPAEGWWERFIGPGKAIDTNKYFVICTNVIGGCYGSTGPSSLDPTDGQVYGTRFPILSIFDMVRAQFKMLDHMGINKLYASVGSSMGGMQSIAAAHLEPERVGKVVSISGSARSSPASIALRYAQRSVLMADPNWNRGFYYDAMPPHTGMKLARQIATFTYRSGPEWEQRFGRRRRPSLSSASFANPSSVKDTLSPNTPPVLCPDFLIETYLDHQGEQFCLKFDANSMLYISKAMDLFSMEIEALEELAQSRQQASSNPALCPPAYKPSDLPLPNKSQATHISTLPSSHAYLPSLEKGLANLTQHPILVLGIQSDVLFPFEQQKELAEAIRRNGNKKVVYYELDSPYGHDTFLIDLPNVGGAIKGFLEGL